MSETLFYKSFRHRVYTCTAPPWLEREHQFFLSLERRTGYQIWLCLIMKSQWLLKANETISKKHSTTSLPTNHCQPAHYQSPTIKVTAAVAVASSPQLS